MRICAQGLVLAVCLACAAPVAASERDDRWRQDLDVTRDQFMAKDRSYSPESRAVALAELARLRAEVETLNDQEIVAGLAKVAAASGNAHTRAYLLRNRGWWRRWPVRVWKFADGWRVVAAQGEAEALIGQRLVSVAGVPVAKAETAVRPLFAGNVPWAAYMASYSLTSPDALIGVGVLEGGGTAEIVTEDDRGRRHRLNLEPMAAPSPQAPRNTPEEAWWYLTAGHPSTAGWRTATPAQAPAYLRYADKNYRFLRCEGDVAYFPFTRAQNGEGETLGQFRDRVLADLAARPARVLIVDLRFNTGGDLTKGQPLFEALAATAFAQTPGRLYVITGPTTFSAAITHAAYLKQATPARFAGTEPGDVLETWSEGGNVLLPNSRINMHFADRAHTYTRRPQAMDPSLIAYDLNVDDLAPDLPAPLTWAAYAAGRDPAAEAILGAPLRCP